MAKKWYVIQTYSGFEAKVKEALLQRIKEHHMEDRFGEVLIPTETVTEQRAGGKTRVRQKTSFPGYIFVEMDMSRGGLAPRQGHPEGHRTSSATSARRRSRLRRSTTCGKTHRRGRGQAEAARLVRGGRRDPRHRRRVRELLGHGRRGEARQAEAAGEGVDLRPRDPGRARFQSGREAGLERDYGSHGEEESSGRIVKLQLPAGKANPAPPVGPALGPHGINIMAFCKEFNAKTQNGDMIIPVVMTVYSRPLLQLHPEDAAGQRPAQEGRRPVDGQEARLRLEGAEQEQGRQGHRRSRSASSPQQKMGDMNCTDIESAMRTVKGTARSMGIDVVD